MGNIYFTLPDTNRDEIRCKENTIPIVSSIISSEDMETVFVIYEDELGNYETMKLVEQDL